MNPEPSKVLQRAVRCLLPQGAREHVLGDLQERFVETGSSAGYLLDALRTLPYIVLGQIIRNVDGRLVAFEAVALIASFALYVLRKPAAGHTYAPAMLAVGVIALAALVLGDAYVEPRNRARYHTLRQPVLAYGAAWVAGLLLGAVIPALAPVPGIVLQSAASGFFFLFMGRILFVGLAGERSSPSAIGSFADVRLQAEGLKRRVRQRNVSEYAGVAIGVVASAIGVFRAHQPLLRAGLAVAIPGLLWAAYELYRRGSSRELPASLSETEAVAFLRSELARQRDALRNVHFWYLGPLVPAMVLISAARIAGHPWSWNLAFPGGSWAGFVFLLWWVNRRGARLLQRQIDALDGWEKQS